MYINGIDTTSYNLSYNKFKSDMKTFLLLALLCFTAFSSCKKEDTGSQPDNLSASFDGISKTFNYSLTGAISSSGGVYGLQVVGFVDNPTTSDALYLSVFSDSPITNGTYVDGQSATIVFADPTVDGTNYSNALSNTNPISITITSISNTNVTGTFSGDLFLNANSSDPKKVVGNGQFSVGLMK
jgi:hypothetical protein